MQKPTAPFPQLETERLWLRPVSMADTEDIFEIFSDDEVTRYYDLAPFTSLQRAEQFINRMNEKFARREGIRWAIAIKPTNQLICTCGYNALYASNRRAVIGYELKRQTPSLAMLGFDSLFLRVTPLILQREGSKYPLTLPLGQTPY